MEIIPAILTSQQSELIELIKQIEQSKKFSRVQIDFVDGEYTVNKSLRVEGCKSIRNYPEIKFDAHLMVIEKNINKYVQAAKKLGFDRIIVQVEKISHPERFSALALDLDTDVSCIDASMHKALDLVLLMSVPAGLGNQVFDERVLPKIEFVKKFGVKVCVDGGIEKLHLGMLEKMGVDEVAVGAKRVLEW